MADEDSRGGVDKLWAKFWQLWADTQAARERSFRDQLGLLFDRFGSTDSLALGVVINMLTITVGAGLYWVLDGPIGHIGTFVAILGALGIVSGVLRL